MLQHKSLVARPAPVDPDASTKGVVGQNFIRPRIRAQPENGPVKSFNYMTEIVLVGSFKNMTKRASLFSSGSL